MHEVTPGNLVEYLERRGHLPRASGAVVETLAGGVSNVVYRVTPVGRPEFVVKQSRGRLRTQAEWRSRIERIWREIDVLKLLTGILPRGAVPALLFEDRDNYLFGMEAIERGHTVWKEALLRGEIDFAIGDVLGGYLARVHAATWDNAETRRVLSGSEAFEELRVDPYYRRIAIVHHDLQSQLIALIDDMPTHARSLALADFSPKNILLTSGGVSLVDFETGHWGDAAFDLGFFLSHLLLKAVRSPRDRAALIALAARFWEAYQGALTLAVDPGEDFEGRAVRHLAACLLSRIDGKSPVDYLDESQRELVRTTSRDWLHSPPESLRACFDAISG